MSLLITDKSGVWMMNRSMEELRPVFTGLSSPCQPCAACGVAAVCCARTRECVCLKARDGSVISRMPCVPGIQEMCLSDCGRYLYQLSAEADCIHVRAVASGGLLFAAPAGVFPRMMQMAGGCMLAAGGAVGEAYVWSLPDVQLLRVIHTRHPCFAVGEWKEGYLLVCASEGEDIHTLVYTLSKKKIRPRLLAELSGLPGTVRVCPDGRHALLSTSDGLMKMELPSGKLLWNKPEWALSMKIRFSGEQALVSDSLNGQVGLMNHHRPWETRILYTGIQPQACFLRST